MARFSALSFLLPERCCVCERPGPALCSLCDAALHRLAPPLCQRCGSPGAWPVRRCAECAGRRLGFASARAAILYDARAKALVASWKEHGRRGLAHAAAHIVADTMPRPDVEALAAVPADAERTRRRGHAPPLRLAHALGRLWELPVLCVLRREKGAGRPQRGLGLEGRRRNVAGAFSAEGHAPRTVCLVDDVYTSGSTASACATELRRIGARRVEVVTLARAVR